MSAKYTRKPKPVTKDAYDRWFDKFKPVKNRIVKDAPYDGRMFETYGPELDHVLAMARLKPKCVWTLLDCDGRLYVSAGYHVVNRIGYFITGSPSKTGTESFKA